jgi:hypothetical protein
MYTYSHLLSFFADRINYTCLRIIILKFKDPLFCSVPCFDRFSHLTVADRA